MLPKIENIFLSLLLSLNNSINSYLQCVKEKVIIPCVFYPKLQNEYPWAVVMVYDC